MAASLLRMQIPWGEFTVYLDEYGYPWLKEEDICKNLGIEKYDDLQKWIKEGYLAQSWCYEKNPYRQFEMISADLSEDWFWYEDFAWWVAGALGYTDFAKFIEKKFEESLAKFLEK